MIDNAKIKHLKEKAKIIRKLIVKMIGEAGSGHPGGSLSATEIVTSLYFHTMKHNPDNPKMEDRDRFVLSKGHGCPVLYAAYAEAGYISKESLWSLRLLNSPLQGHPDKRFLPILEASTGSLGQGLSIGLGMALGARLNKDDFYTYVLLGDGECDEGQVWEAAMAAAHFQVDNLIAIVDKNKQQLDGWTKDIMGLEPFGEKWKSFGWEVKEIDGHNFSEIISAFEEAKKTKGKPFVIIAHTIKGKGVSFMENNLDFHGAAPTKEETERALKEIEESNS